MYLFEAALKNLIEQGNLFEDSMKNLRHLSWAKEDKKDEPELALLRKQNSVLREVIKNLKRKVGVFDLYSEEFNKPRLKIVIEARVIIFL